MSGWVRASAPGKLMLLGEHAVLYGRRAVVCAVNRRLMVKARRRSDGAVVVESDLGRFQVPRGKLQPQKPFSFVLQAVLRMWPVTEGGVELVVQSDFSVTLGLGSSAAVTVATVAALTRLRGLELEPEEVFQHARDIVRNVQGRGSGADVAAATFGGTLLYDQRRGVLDRIEGDYPLVVVYSGSKTPTTQVIRQVGERVKKQSQLYEKIFDAMDVSAVAGFEALKVGDLASLGELLTLNQGLMDALGVSNTALWKIVLALRGKPGILGAKISGSGLGDCVVAVGSLEVPRLGSYAVHPMRPSAQGVAFD